MHRVAVLALIATTVFAAPVSAQDPSEAGRELPAICQSADKGAAPMAMEMGPMDKAHMDMMQGMDAMNAHMNEGMMAKDIDVAFVCGMIPHHQGAIDMAKAELAHGDDPWARAMAQKVIDAQTKEIADMIDWLKKQSK